MTEQQKTTRRGHRVDKKVRVPFGGHRQKLQLSEADANSFEEKGRVLRWFNDIDGRLERAITAGYDFVEPGEVPSLGAAGLHQENSDLNGKVSKVVSKSSKSGQPIRAYLMSISKEWYDEDQRDKEEVNLQVDRALKAVDDGGQSIEGGYTPR